MSEDISIDRSTRRRYIVREYGGIEDSFDKLSDARAFLKSFGDGNRTFLIAVTEETTRITKKETIHTPK